MSQNTIDKKELKFMNGRVRQFFQKHYEFKTFKGFLKSYGIQLEDKTILDVGCGSGYSSQLIMKELRPRAIVAFDIIPEEIEYARRRDLNVDFFVGDVTHLGLPGAKFDAAFVFGVLHHIVKWRDAVSELARVLKPGGVLLIEEPNKKAMRNEERWFKLEHPEGAGFEWLELIKAIKGNGFQFITSKRLYRGHLLSMMFILSNDM